MDATPDESALAWHWLSIALEGGEDDAAARRIVEAAASRGNPDALWLSEGLEAVAVGLSLRRVAHPLGQHEWLVERLHRLRTHGTPRSVQLGEAALALRFGHGNSNLDELIAWLQGHGPLESDARPPIERVWTDAALCGLLAERGHYDEALQHGLQADTAARAAGHEGAICIASQVLGFVFLSTGDMDGALGVLPPGIAAATRFGRPAPTLHYNLLLAWSVGERWSEASAWLDAHPWLLEPDLLAGLPVLNPVLAAVLASQGQLVRARPLMHADLPEIWARPAIQANRAWLLALVELTAGQPEAARQRIQAFLSGVTADAPLSRMNATQLNEVLSRACEALGDERGALQALKRSRDACFSWVAESMRSRLQVLDQATASGSPVRLQRQRQEAIETRIAELRADQAEAALARSERYFSLAVHDIRTPVNGLVGMTSLLALSRLDEQQKRYVALAQSSAQILMSLCNDLLDIARIRAGQFSLNPADTDVGALVQQLTASFEADAALAGLQLTCRVAPAVPPSLWCDEARLRQVLTNLLSNAIKFTREGSVHIDTGWTAAAPDKGELVIKVRDTGLGLSPQEMDGLFQDFSQFDADVKRRSQGSGLGLATCRELADLMAGRIEVHSVVGQGSCFTLRLPLATCAGRQIGCAGAPGPTST